MIETFALRHLLLRQLWVIRGEVDKGLFEEITRSLALTQDRNQYLVTWRRGGQAFEKTYPRSAFQFYKRGDRPDSVPSSFKAEKNNLDQARKFALEALELDGREGIFEVRGRVINSHEVIAFFWNFFFCAVLAASGDENVDGLAIILLVNMSLEFIPRFGRLLTSVGIWGFVFLGFPAVAFFTGIFYGGAQILDSNPRLRMSRVFIALAAGAYVVWFSDWPSYSFNSAIYGGMAFAVVSTISIVRWLIGSHVRVLPLVVPFMSPVLAAEGYYVSAFVLGIDAFLSLIARLWGHHLLPLQQERILTPNG